LHLSRPPAPLLFIMRVVATERRLRGLLRLTVIALDREDCSACSCSSYYLVRARTLMPPAMAREGFKLPELHRAVGCVRAEELQAWLCQAEAEAKQRIETLVRC